jgi:hypothetical protein
MFNILSLQGNANQKYTEILSHPSQYDYQENNNVDTMAHTCNPRTKVQSQSGQKVREDPSAPTSTKE